MKTEKETGVRDPGRAALIFAGVVTAVTGIVILVWPGKAAMAITAIIAVYAVIVGLIYGGIGIFGKSLKTGSRIGHVLLGVLYIVAGCVALVELSRSAAFLALFVVIMVGVMWIIEGFVSLVSLEEGSPKAATVVFAIISVIAGFMLLSSPLWAAVLLWWLLATSLIIIGVVNVFRGVTKSRNS